MVESVIVDAEREREREQLCKIYLLFPALSSVSIGVAAAPLHIQQKSDNMNKVVKNFLKRKN